MRGIARALTSFVLIATLVVAVLLVVLGFLARPGKDGISKIDGHPVLTVLSGSMVPVFHPGDMIVDDSITASQADRLAPGDIITFHVAASSTELITHRIFAVKRVGSGVMYQTKGDHNNAPDSELVAPSQVVGTYTGHLRYAGYVLRAVHNKIFLFLLIFIPILYLIGTWIAKHWRDSAPADAEDENSLADKRDEEAEVSGEHVLVHAPSVGTEDSLSVASANGRIREGGVEGPSI